MMKATSRGFAIDDLTEDRQRRSSSICRIAHCTALPHRRRAISLGGLRH